MIDQTNNRDMSPNGPNEVADAGVPEPERPDAGYMIPPPMGLTGSEWFDTDKARASVLRLESQLLNFVPYVGMLKGFYEALDGKDLLTDDELSLLDRAINTLPVLALNLQLAAKGFEGAANLERSVKGIEGAANLERNLANQIQGAERFSTAMREIAVASGDADLLLDSLMVRLAALKEISMLKDARDVVQLALLTEMATLKPALDLLRSLNDVAKLAEMVDAVADGVGFVSALAGGTGTLTEASDASGSPSNKQSSSEKAGNEKRIEKPVTPADANATDAATGLPVRTSNASPSSPNATTESTVPSDNYTPDSANLTDQSGSEVFQPMSFNSSDVGAFPVAMEALDSGYIDLPAIDVSEALNFTPLDSGSGLDLGIPIGFEPDGIGSGLDAPIHDNGLIADGGTGLGQGIDDFLPYGSHETDLGLSHDAGMSIGHEGHFASFDPGSDSALFSPDPNYVQDGGTSNYDSGFTDDGSISSGGMGPTDF